MDKMNELTQRMFRKSLTDLVRGLRNNKSNESAYINQCVQEIKTELKQDSKEAKANAIQKLTYLQMFGYDMSWAAFNVVELMSHKKFTHKRIAYLAASQSFNDGTEVSLLATNFLRKDFLKNQGIYEAGIAIGCLANICSPGLARDLAAEVVNMLTSSRPYIRKKSVLVLYKIFLKYPEALRPSFKRLQQKLDDPDPAVVSAAVNVICELARKNPRSYLPLAPSLFKLLQSSNNNWMLIKVIKLFASLTPIEPRLARRLVDPLTNIINTTNAMSLLYECIQTCIIGMKQYAAIMRLCLTKLRMFIEHHDQNLKYLGLLAMHKIMTVYPKGVSEHRDIVLGCLDDEDSTIRMRALDLLQGMVTRKNLQLIIRKLISHVEDAEGEFRDGIIEKIIVTCSQKHYTYITDFEWYIGMLVDLTHFNDISHGDLIRDQLLDVCVRVKVVREYGVEQMIQLLRDPRFLNENPQANGICEALYAASWITGEYCDLTKDHLPALEALLQPRVTSLPYHIQSLYLSAILKLFSRLCERYEKVTPPAGKRNKIDIALEMIEDKIEMFTRSQHLEVQERACFISGVLETFKTQRAQGISITPEVTVMFGDALNPVAAIAQDKVRQKGPPAGVDLDKWINDPPEFPDEMTQFAENGGMAADNTWKDWEHELAPEVAAPQAVTLTPEELAARRRARNKAKSADPYFLTTGDEPEEDYPVQSIDPNQLGMTNEEMRNAFTFKTTSNRGRRRGPHGRRRGPRKQYSVMTEFEMPEGVDEDPTPAPNATPAQELDPAVASLAQIDLTNIDPTEALPQLVHHDAQAQRSQAVNSPANRGVPGPPNRGRRGRGVRGRRGGRVRRGGRGRRGGRTRGGRRGRPRPGPATNEGRPAPMEKTPSGGMLLKFDNDPTPAPAPQNDKPSSHINDLMSINGELSGAPAQPGSESAPAFAAIMSRLNSYDGKPGDEPKSQAPSSPAAQPEQSPTVERVARRRRPRTASRKQALANARQRGLFRDDMIDVKYEVKVNPNMSDKVLVTFSFHAPKQAIVAISLNFINRPECQCQRPEGTPRSGPFDTGVSVAANSVEKYNVVFRLSQITKTIKLKCSAFYTVEGQNKRRKNCMLTIPCGFLIKGVEISSDAFRNVISNFPLVETSTNCSVETTKQYLQALFRLVIVDDHGDRVSLYGKTIQGLDVAILIKSRDDGGSSLAARCKDPRLTDSIVDEINRLSPRFV